jgi:hypothetical protein
MNAAASQPSLDHMRLTINNYMEVHSAELDQITSIINDLKTVRCKMEQLLDISLVKKGKINEDEDDFY